MHAERALARASASSPVVVRRRVAKKTLRDARDKKCNFVVGRHARLARGDADDQGPGARRRRSRARVRAEIARDDADAGSAGDADRERPAHAVLGHAAGRRRGTLRRRRDARGFRTAVPERRIQNRAR